MRKLLLLCALVSAVSLARAADAAPLATNSIPFGEHGTLEALTPTNWTMLHTNLPGYPPTVELHSLSNSIVIRLSIRWDKPEEKIPRPTEADMDRIVSNTVVIQYLPIAVEKTFTVEKLKGPGVTGSFARFTDAGWTPVVKDEYQNLMTGMFRCENLWGTFDLLTNDKNGPLFQEGLKVMESLHRQP
jgi:hypothetical protein